MKTDKLIDAIGKIDDRYISEAHERKERKSFSFGFNWPTVMRLATACCCILLAVTILPKMFSSAKEAANGGAADSAVYYYNSGTVYDGEYYMEDAKSEEYSASYSTNQEAKPSDDYGNVDPDLVEPNKKLIVTAHMATETQDLDATIRTLTSQVAAYNGYVQRSSTYNRVSSRIYEATYRIPANSYQAFLAAIEDSGNVLSYSEETEDITNTYTDIEARLNTLKAQEERVMELYKQAESIADLMEIESRLSDLRYRIEYYEAQIRNYDLLVAYSTLTISVTETTVYTPTSTSFWTRLGNAFTNGWHNFTDGIGDFLIDVVYNLWSILLLVVLGYAAYRIYRHFRNRRNG